MQNHDSVHGETMLLIHKGDISWLVSQGYLNDQQADPLWRALEVRTSLRQRVNFGASPVLMWMGVAICIVAMIWILVWSAFTSDVFFCLVTALYIIIMGGSGYGIWTHKLGPRLPRALGGTLITAAVCLFPFFLAGAHSPTWLWVLGLLLACGLVLPAVPFPLLMLPLYYGVFTLFVYCMPVYVFRMDDSYYSSAFEHVQATICFFFGLIMVCVSQLGTSVLRAKVEEESITEEKAVIAEGFLFWFLLCSSFSLFLGITYFMMSFGWWMDILCFFAYALLLGAGAYYRRGILVIFGAIGLFLLTTDVFASLFTGNIWAAGVVMTVVGLAIIAGAIGVHYYWQRSAPESERQSYEDIESYESVPLTHNTHNTHNNNVRGSYQYGEEMADMGSFVGGSTTPGSPLVTSTVVRSKPTTTTTHTTTTTPTTTTSSAVRAVPTPLAPSALASRAAPFTITDYDDVDDDDDDDNDNSDNKDADASPSLTRHVPNL